MKPFRSDTKTPMYYTAEIVKKEISRSPIWFGYWYDPNGSHVHVGWKCSNSGTKYRVYYADYDYCPYCGQRIGWTKGEIK